MRCFLEIPKNDTVEIKADMERYGDLFIFNIGRNRSILEVREGGEKIWWEYIGDLLYTKVDNIVVIYR